MAGESDKLIEPEAAAPAPEGVPPAEAVSVAEAPVVEAPAKARRGRKARPAAVQTDSDIPATEPVAEQVVVAAEAPAPIAAAPEPTVPAAVRRPVGRPRRVAPSVAAPKPVAKISPKIAVAKAPAPKAALRKASAPAAPAKTTTKPAPTPIITKPTASAVLPALTQLKEQLMTDTTDFIAPFKTAISEIQDKAKTAYEKSTEALTEANDFAKGNVEALVESSKIFASGLQELGASAVAETRTAFDALTADVKELASVKSPTEFFQLQSTLVRKSFDSIVAQASKSTEAMLKLANDVASPLSSRVSLAVEKAAKVA